MYYIFGISLIVTFFYVINAAATFLAIGLWHIVGNNVRQTWSARRRADFVFALRVFPFVSAIIFVALFLIPAYILFEPRSTNETIGIAQALISAACTAGILRAICRIFQSILTTRRVVSGWLKDSEPILIDGVVVPVYRIRHPFPIVAVVGIFRPQMFVADQICDSLTAEEFEAAITHENGHLIAGDNLKRTLLRFCRDLLVLPAGKILEKDWAISAEAGADEYAAHIGGNPAAINLAAALVKIARIVPKTTENSMPVGAYLIEEQTAAVAFRIERLIKITERGTLNVKQNSKFSTCLCAYLCLTVALLLAADYDFLYKIHRVLEVFVTLQQ